MIEPNSGLTGREPITGSSSIQVSPGETLKEVSDHMRELTARIKKSVLSLTADILEVAQLCAEADESLNTEEKKQFIGLLPFSRPTFSKFVKIGNDHRLRESPLLELLPQNHTLLYPIAQLDNDELDAAVDEGVIYPKMKRADLLQWTSERRGKDVHAPVAPARDGSAADQDGDDSALERSSSSDALDALRAAWAKSELAEAWSRTPPDVRARFVHDVLGILSPS